MKAPYILAGALFSPCGAFRLRLWRMWDAERPRVVWVMLNPSTADGDLDDATILTIVAISKALDFGGLEVVNLYAYRATDPADLKRAGYPVGPGNDQVIRTVCEMVADEGGRIFVGWGANAKHERAAQVMESLRGIAPVYHFGLTKSWQPRHPLYLKHDSQPIEWAALA